MSEFVTGQPQRQKKHIEAKIMMNVIRLFSAFTFAFFALAPRACNPVTGGTKPDSSYGEVSKAAKDSANKRIAEDNAVWDKISSFFRLNRENP